MNMRKMIMATIAVAAFAVPTQAAVSDGSIIGGPCDGMDRAKCFNTIIESCLAITREYGMVSNRTRIMLEGMREIMGCYDFRYYVPQDKLDELE